MRQFEQHLAVRKVDEGVQRDFEATRDRIQQVDSSLEGDTRRRQIVSRVSKLLDENG